MPHVCLNGCGAKVSKAETRCRACQRNRQQHIAATANQGVVARRIYKSLVSGTSLGIMYLDNEPHALQWHCSAPGCTTPMLINCKCYYHATGRPITITARPRIVLRDEITP